MADAAAWRGPRCPPALPVPREGGTIPAVKDLQPWQTAVTGDGSAGNSNSAGRGRASPGIKHRGGTTSPRLSPRPQRGCRGRAGLWCPLPSPGAPGTGMGFSLDTGKGGKQRCAQSHPGGQTGGCVWLSSLSWGQQNLRPLTKAGAVPGNIPIPNSALSQSPGSPHREVNLGFVQTSCRLTQSLFHSPPLYSPQITPRQTLPRGDSITDTLV